MRKTLGFAVPAVLGIALSTTAAPPRSQSPESPLAALGFLIGKWEEQRVPPAYEGRTNHLEMAWDLEGSVIRRSEVRSEDGKRWRVTGIIAWNPVSEHIEFQEHADWGNFVRGTIDVLGEGSVRRNMEVSYPDGSSASWRTTLTATDADTFRTQTERLIAGEWRVQWELAGKRVSSFPWEVSAVGRPDGYTADNDALAAAREGHAEHQRHATAGRVRVRQQVDWRRIARSFANEFLRGSRAAAPH